MGYRILYFYKRENVIYKEKRGGNLSFVEKELGDAEEPFLKVFFCGLPEYYGLRAGQLVMGRLWKRATPGSRTAHGNQSGKERYVPWNPGQLLRLMQNCCEYVSADAYYLEEHFEKELAESGLGFTPGRQRMCGGLIKKMSGQFQGIDSILYLRGDSGEQTGELPVPEKLLRKLHYFFYLGEKSGQYAALEENLWREYGMPLFTVKNMSELAPCQIKRLLVLDDRQEGGAEWEMLPRGCVYMDLWSDAGRRAQIEKNRADIKYISEYLYLCRNLDR